MKILWHSNAPWSVSGYGNQSAIFLPKIQALGHDVAASCFYGLEGGQMDWNGIRCYPTDYTRFGMEMLPEYADHFGGGNRGDRANVLTFTLMDVWVMLQAAAAGRYEGMPFACWTPIDHDPAPPMVVQFLEKVQARVIAMTRFGQDRLAAHGFEPYYVPHGIDTDVFKPDADRRTNYRQAVGISEDAFVIGMVACNQGFPSRKAFPQVFEAFAEFQRRHDDAVLYVHCDIVGRNHGVNLLQLAQACNIPSGALKTSPQLDYHLGFPQEVVSGIYNIFDVLAMPSFGEGFGIPLIEAQACGVPVITSDWTAMSELCGAGWLVKGDRWWDQTQMSFQQVPAVSEILEALEAAYDKRGDEDIRKAARAFAEPYDANLVFEAHFKPVLAELDRPREVPPLKIAA